MEQLWGTIGVNHTPMEQLWGTLHAYGAGKLRSTSHAYGAALGYLARLWGGKTKEHLTRLLAPRRFLSAPSIPSTAPSIKSALQYLQHGTAPSIPSSAPLDTVRSPSRVTLTTLDGTHWTAFTGRLRPTLTHWGAFFDPH